MTSPDYRTLRWLSLVAAAILAAGVAWRATSSSGDIVDMFFVGLVVALVVAALVFARCSVGIEPGMAPVGDVVVVRNGIRTHRVPASSILTVDLVEPGDRDLATGRAARSRLQAVRLGLIDGPSVIAMALLVEPGLRARSSGAGGVAPAVTVLRAAAGLDTGPPGRDADGTDRRMDG